MSTLHQVKFAGSLKKKWGEGTKVAGANMWQVMQGLKFQFGPEFAEDIRKGKWHVLVGKKKGNIGLSEEDLGKPINERVIHIIPAVEGKSAAVRIIVGVVLIVVGVLYNQPWLVQVGAAMAFGGVAELLLQKKLGQPGTDKSDQKASDIYNGPVNITEQGVPIPVICGRVSRASSVLISTDFSSEEVTP